MSRLTIDQARRCALAAQGLDRRRAAGRVDVRHFRRVVDRLGLIQLDSVNVFSRAHYMPFFSRLGPYDREALDRWLWRSGEMFEYWGHEASLLPLDDLPLFRHRMNGGWHWERVERIRREHPGYLEDVLAQVREKGPLQTRDLVSPGQRDADSMWGWSNGKVALEALFLEGRVTTSDRRNFVRLYDVTERVIPRQHLELPPVPEAEAQMRLLEKAAAALGVATVDDLADYYRIRAPKARPLVDRLLDGGRLEEVEVEGWRRAAYLHREARLPRAIAGRALLSPFDNLIWYRPRVERLWGFHYRIEIYVPERKRVHGYYVLPFLLDGELVARVDLKSDRKAGRLLVRGAFAEPATDRDRVGSELREELEEVASWLGLGEIDVADNGDLAARLRR